MEAVHRGGTDTREWGRWEGNTSAGGAGECRHCSRDKCQGAQMVGGRHW